MSRKSALSVFVLGLLLGWCHQSTVGDQPDTSPKTVKLSVDYDDGVEKHFTQIA